MRWKMPLPACFPSLTERPAEGRTPQPSSIIYESSSLPPVRSRFIVASKKLPIWTAFK